MEVVVKDTMQMKDKDGDGVLTAKEFWEFGEEDGSLDLFREFFGSRWIMDMKRAEMFPLDSLCEQS